jgi:hypothetical protein
MRGALPGTGMLTVSEMAEARVLWETTDMSASDIAARFTTAAKEVTKNVIIGHVSRHSWKPRADSTKPPRTLHDRLDALHEDFNRKVGLPPGSRGRSR